MQIVFQRILCSHSLPKFGCPSSQAKKMQRFVGESLIGTEKWDNLFDWAGYRALDLATLTAAGI